MAAMLQEEVNLIQKLESYQKGAELRNGPSKSMLTTRELPKISMKQSGIVSIRRQSHHVLTPSVAVPEESQPEELECASPGKRSNVTLSRSTGASPALKLIRKLSRAPTTLETALADAEEDEDREQPYTAQVQRLIASASAQFIDKKTEKLVFDRQGAVVAINKGLTKKEKEEAKLEN